jgi:hypothetical protein
LKSQLAESQAGQLLWDAATESEKFGDHRPDDATGRVGLPDQTIPGDGASEQGPALTLRQQIVPGAQVKSVRFV